jgi:hypothetical protein
LASWLTRPTLDALIAGLVGHDDSPVTVGQLIELFEQNQLVNIFNVGPSRAGEVRWALVRTGLIDPSAVPLAGRWLRSDADGNGHHHACPRHR